MIAEILRYHQINRERELAETKFRKYQFANRQKYDVREEG